MNRTAILSGLETAAFGRELALYERLDSTNDTARELAAGGAPEGTVVVALDQIKGRGRQDRAWVSEPGMNLTFSIVLRPRIPAGLLGVVPLFAAAGVAATVAELCPGPVGCKWPNDVLVKGRKISGILCESKIAGSSASWVVAGIGVNVNQRMFPTALGSSATSIALESGRDHDLAATLCRILLSLETRYRGADPAWPADAVTAWTERNVVVGSAVVGDRGGTRISGVARGVSPAGALLVETAAGTVEFAAGDVHMVS